MLAELLIGLLGGIAAGMLGVGGGVLFVPALAIGAGLSQLHAEATSLLAIIPVALVGTWRQHARGNADLRTGATLGVLAAGGAVAGGVVANVVPQRVLEIGFALLLLVIAGSLAQRALTGSGRAPERP
jgi:uncharacterized membrane protein YfcA